MQGGREGRRKQVPCCGGGCTAAAVDLLWLGRAGRLALLYADSAPQPAGNNWPLG